MRTGFRRIASFMDAVDPPASMKRLAGMHGLGPHSVVLGEVWRRHNDARLVEQRFLFLNTFLMDIKIDNPIAGATKGTKPRVPARAREIGNYLRRSADVAALCEVWTTTEKEYVLSQWPTEPVNVHRITKFMVTEGGGNVFRREERKKGSSGLLTISQRFPVSGDQFEEYQHDSGWDERADKGVLLAKLDPGMGPSSLCIYSTHLQAGNVPVALKQVVQLGKFILETRGAANPAIVAGDFNIKADETGTFSTAEVLDVNFPVPPLIRSAVLERVVNGATTGVRSPRKTAYGILTDVLGVLGFYDLWAGRNGGPGYTSDPTEPGIADLICPPDRRDGRFCEDNIRTLGPSQASRIDYLFAARPSADSSFTVDYTRPRRVRLERDADAPGKGEIAFLSDHIGLMTTLLLVPRKRT